MKLIDRNLAIEQLGEKVMIHPKNLYVSKSLYNAFKKACSPYSASEMLVNLESQAYANVSKDGLMISIGEVSPIKDRAKLGYSCSDEHEDLITELSRSMGLKLYVLRELIMKEFLKQYKERV